MELFIKRLQSLLDEKDLNQKELAKKVGVTEVTISRYMNGERKPRVEIANKIAAVLNTTTDYLLGNSDIKNPYTDKPLTEKDEKDIAKDLENTLTRLEGAQDGLMFDGEALDDETRELLRISLEHSMRVAKEMAKKYTPKKYRK